MKQISTKAKSWINLIVFLITLILNYLTAYGFINGMSQKVVSNKYNTLITPAGFAFSIWGIIYSLIGISLIYMLDFHPVIYLLDADTIRYRNTYLYVLFLVKAID